MGGFYTNVGRGLSARPEAFAGWQEPGR